jgi:hypothetical protein
LRWADPHQRGPTDFVEGQETEKAAKAQQRVVQPEEEEDDDDEDEGKTVPILNESSTKS